MPSSRTRSRTSTQSSKQCLRCVCSKQLLSSPQEKSSSHCSVLACTAASRVARAPGKSSILHTQETEAKDAQDVEALYAQEAETKDQEHKQSTNSSSASKKVPMHTLLNCTGHALPLKQRVYLALMSCLACRTRTPLAGRAVTTSSLWRCWLLSCNLHGGLLMMHACLCVNRHPAPACRQRTPTRMQRTARAAPTSSRKTCQHPRCRVFLDHMAA